MAHHVQYRKDVALKIMIPGEKGEYEYQMQTEILRTVCDTSHLVTNQDSLLLPGHGGNHHRVLVLPLFGPSLSYHAMQLPVTTRVSEAAARRIEGSPRCWTRTSRYAPTRNPRPEYIYIFQSRYLAVCKP